MDVAFTNPAKGTFYAQADVFAIDGRGAILAGITVPNFNASTDRESFYRLSPQAQQWQAIGNIEGTLSPVSRYSGTLGDVLWAFGAGQGWSFAPYP